MEIAGSCFKAQGGIIVPIYDIESETVRHLSKDHVSISVKNYGVDVLLRDIIVPIPEFMLDFFIDNNTITLYSAHNCEYLWEPVAAVEIPKRDLLEATGAYKYARSNERESKEEL